MTQRPNHALQRTRRERRGCHRCVPCAGSLSSGSSGRFTRAMTKAEMQRVLADELAQFRTWSYSALAEAVERTRREHDHLHRVERTDADGTAYFIDFDVFW